METILRQMDAWYRTPLGNCLLETEYAALTPYLQDCFGGHILQIGGGSEVSLFYRNANSNLIRLIPESTPTFKGPTVRAAFDALPFLPESIDIVLLPHLLEFTPNPFAVLTQSQIVLAPEGRLIILSFNAWSLWGLYRYVTSDQNFPWQGNFFGSMYYKKWLFEQGFVIEAVRSLFFRPPIASQLGLKRWVFSEALGRLLWANNGAVHLIVARKRIVPLIPIREPFQYASTI